MAAVAMSQVRRVIWITLGLNLLVCAAKAAYGLWSGSLAVTTDAFHSMLDGGSNVLGLVALKAAANPPDMDHPYGHQKIEMIAASAIGLIIGAGSFRFAWTAVAALVHHAPPPQIASEGFVIMGATLVTNVFVATYEAREGRRLKSPFLIADAAHTTTDILVTLAVIGSLIATRAGVAWADPVATIGVMVVILLVAWRILSENLGVLLDRVAVDAARIRELVVEVPGIAGCHRVRSRGVETAIQIDLHIQVDGELPLRRAHDISHAVERKLRTTLPGVVDVTIHVEPDDDDEEHL